MPSTLTELKMPKYVCHKEVHALKISQVDLMRDGGSGRLHVKVPFDPIAVSIDYMNRHKPKVGGYYVVYEDGYESFSPAKAFGEGYTEIK